MKQQTIRFSALVLSCCLLVQATTAQNKTAKQGGTESQRSKKPANSTSTKSARAGASKGGNAALTDTGFLRAQIVSNIREIQLAQLALDRADAPKVKTMARTIINDYRQMLQQMLSIAKTSDLQGLPDTEVFRDSASAAGQVQGGVRSADTYNTATDSLGSGSSGSGHVSHGANNDTLATAYTGDKKDYSHTGDAYQYEGPQPISGIEDLFRVRGKAFDSRWTSVMLSLHQNKLSQFSRATPTLKNHDLLSVVSQSVPRIQMHIDELTRFRTGATPGSGIGGTPDDGGQDNNNTAP